MDEMVVRDAMPEDVKAIWQLNLEGLGYDYPFEDTAQQLQWVLQSPHNKLLVALLWGKVAGYLHLCDYDCTYAKPLKNILAIAVAPASQRAGVGRCLLNAGEAWAKAQGAAGIRLVSGENRAGAHKFYLACGYTHRKTQRNFIKYFS